MTNIEPIAWAVMQPDSYRVFATYGDAISMRDACNGGEIVPLYSGETIPLKEPSFEEIANSIAEWISYDDFEEATANWLKVTKEFFADWDSGALNSVFMRGYFAGWSGNDMKQFIKRLEESQKISPWNS